MAVVNATNQFAVVGNKLALSYSAMAREVAFAEAGSVGDGEFGAQPITGRLLVDMRLHWKSAYTVPVIVESWYQRQRRTLQMQFGNFAYIRERYTAAVGVDSTSQILAPEPTTYPDWNTEFGGGLNAAQSLGGAYRTSMCETSCQCIFPTRVLPGQSLDVRVRATLFTQDPFAGGNPGNFVYAYSNFLRFRAFPENGS